MVPVTTNQMSLKHDQNPWNFHEFSSIFSKHDETMADSYGCPPTSQMSLEKSHG
jgi:hypothetical protein